MSSPRTKREATQELLDDVTLAKRMKTAGRPTRKSAGKKTLPAGFVNTEEAFTKEDGEQSSSESESDIDDDGQRQRLAHKRRGPSPPPPELPPDPPELDDILAGRTSTDGTTATVISTASTSASQLSFTFHVPPNHTGPFVVNFQMPTNTLQNSWQKSIATTYSGMSSSLTFQ